MILASKLPLVRVSANARCPVCGKPDWCSVDAGGRFAICMRVPSARPTQNGGFLHKLTSSAGITRRPAPMPSVTGASAGTRDLAYRSLVERLCLSEQAAADLRRRGLSEEMVVNQLYATVPESAGMRAVMAEISGIVTLNGIPGFFIEHGEWKLNAVAGDLIVPVRDAAGRIVGCQLRSDRAERRYRWLSSAGKPHGAAATAHPHFALAYLVERQRFAIVTEGPLKGDTIADRLHRAVVANPGADTFSADFGRALRALLPELRAVAVAYDADAREKPPVMGALRRLVRVLSGAGLKVTVWRWERALGKGLDDVLNAEGPCASWQSLN